jgi:Tfp pilus assembly protein PilO
MEKIIRKSEKGRFFGSKLNNFLIDYFKWLVTLLMVVILSVGFFFIIWPKYKQVTKKIEAAGRTLEIKRQQLTSYLKGLNELNDNFKNVSSADLSKVDEILPTADGTEDLYTQLEVIVKNNGLILTSLNIAAPEESGITGDDESVVRQVKQIKITMSVSGVNYGSLKGLLRSLENNLRLMDVKQVTFAPAEETVALELITFYFD